MSAAIYWLAIRLYAIALRIASVFNPKARLFVNGRKGLLSRIKYALVNERRPRIWIHCASLGEFEQGRPVIEKLRKQYPNYALVLTFFSPSGYEVRKDYDGADYVFYLPIDSYYNATRFLKTVQPKLAIFVKYEFWYNFLKQTAKRDIPLLLISATFRQDQPFFKWYGSLHRSMLKYFSRIFVQDELSKTLLNKIGIEDSIVAGDTRFDRVIEAADEVTIVPGISEFCEAHKVLIAGSTWKEDEAFLQQAYQLMPPHWKLIIVPHEVHESHIAEIEFLFKDQIIRWSEFDSNTTKKVLVVDSIGLLLRLYKYANVAWVGGGLDNNGVHNVLEAAVYGKPVLHGPVFDQYIEAKNLVAAGGAFVPETPEKMVELLRHWQQHTDSYANVCKVAKDFVMSNGGATNKILNYLEAKKILTVL